MIRKLFFLCSILLISGTAFAQLKPADFAKNIDYFSVKISPDGKHLAVGLKGDQEQRLAILDTKTFKTVGTAALAGKSEVGDFYWANNERIIVKVLFKRKDREDLLYAGELFAVDLDGGNPNIIYGYSAGGSETGTKLKRKKRTFGWAELLHFLPEDDEHILISSTPFSEDGGAISSVFKLHVDSGRTYTLMKRVPLTEPDYVLDKAGNLRFISGRDVKTKNRKVLKYDMEEKEWLPVPEIKMNAGVQLVTMNAAGTNLYFFSDNDAGMQGLYRMNIDSGEVKEIYTPENVDITDAVFSSKDFSAYAIRVDEHYPEYLVFDKKNEEAEVFKSLLATFPGKMVTITSRSEDDKKWVLHVASDTSPGTFYLYDREEQQILFLFAELADLPEKQLVSSDAIEVNARDGQILRGYITYPIEKKAKNPLVVLVHGGPRLRDYWVFDREVQMLASQGYAVLRINFRGSNGYGTKFMRAGNKKWGSLIQQDIIDAAKWAAAQPDIDGENMCIMGASFGGYSAVQSSILEPGLFQCAVANVGVYDLELLYEEGDIQEYYFGKEELEFMIGTDNEQLRINSPVHYVEKLKAPIFIAHGGEDVRAPLEHAEALREAMDKVNKSYEWFVKTKEGHGFNDPENRAEYYEAVAKFLAEHLK